MPTTSFSTTGELDYLRKMFGDRATVYPTGGHCGNLDHHQVASFMTAYFGPGEVHP